jgi:hypothetical protein
MNKITSKEIGLFKTGQYDKLYITVSDYRGTPTIRIQVLPKDEEAKSNGSPNMCLNENAVIVYGQIEENSTDYAWTHQGKWQDDFYKMVDEKNNHRIEEEFKLLKNKLGRELKEKNRQYALLQQY